MGRTTLEYDDQLLQKAQKALGTTGIKPTIEKALNEVVTEAGRRQLLARLRSGKQIGPTPEELERLRAPQIPSSID